jgi:hypothetical protein
LNKEHPRVGCDGRRWPRLTPLHQGAPFVWVSTACYPTLVVMTVSTFPMADRLIFFGSFSSQGPRGSRSLPEFLGSGSRRWQRRLTVWPTRPNTGNRNVWQRRMTCPHRNPSQSREMGRLIVIPSHWSGTSSDYLRSRLPPPVVKGLSVKLALCPRWGPIP